MKLSIIIPCLKRDALVERAIRSIGGGRPNVEMEFVVVEGMSPVGRARNAGLSRATGDYVAWIDGDDEVTSDWLAEIVRAAEQGVDVIVFDAVAVGWRRLKDLVYGGSENPDPDEVVRDVWRNARLQGHLWRIVSRRELWQGLRFDEQTIAAEDFLILPFLMARAGRIAYLPKKLYRYVRNEKSVMNEGGREREIRLISVALERCDRSELRFASAARWGSADVIYRALTAIDSWPKAGLSIADRRIVAAGRRFLARHLLSHWRESAFLGSLRLRLRWELKFMVAALGVRKLLRRIVK